LIKLKLENWNNAFASRRAAGVYYPVYLNSKVNGVYPSMGRMKENKPEITQKESKLELLKIGSIDCILLQIILKWLNTENQVIDN
jgi:hypothetical protein